MTASAIGRNAVLVAGALASAALATLATVALVWTTAPSPAGTSVQWGPGEHPWTAGLGAAAVLVLLAARGRRRRRLSVLGAVLAAVAGLTTLGAFGDDVVGPAPWLALAGYAIAAVLAGLDARTLS